jgi:hypothetical protein
LTVQGPATTKRDRPGQSNKATNDPYGISRRITNLRELLSFFWRKQRKMISDGDDDSPHPEEEEKKRTQSTSLYWEETAPSKHTAALTTHTTRKPAVTLFFSFFSFLFFYLFRPFLNETTRFVIFITGLKLSPSILAFFVSVFTRRTSWLKEKMVVGAISILPTVFVLYFSQWRLILDDIIWLTLIVFGGKKIISGMS